MGQMGHKVEANKERKEWEKHEQFFSKLLGKFPELKYIEINNIFYDDSSLADAHRSQLLELMNYFKSLQAKGYSEDAAFAKIEDKYRSKIEEKKKNFDITKTLAMNNGMRS
jgi:hypothetical protein